MNFRLAHLITKPARAYAPACATDISKSIWDAKKNGPLVGPVVITRVAPFDQAHPLHSRFAVTGVKP